MFNLTLPGNPISDTLLEKPDPVIFCCHAYWKSSLLTVTLSVLTSLQGRPLPLCSWQWTLEPQSSIDGPGDPTAPPCWDTTSRRDRLQHTWDLPANPHLITYHQRNTYTLCANNIYSRKKNNNNKTSQTPLCNLMFWHMKFGLTRMPNVT